MSELATTALILGGALTAHVAFWRMRTPRRDVFCLLAVGGVSLMVVGGAGALSCLAWVPQSGVGWVQSVAAAAVVWLAYCEFYLAIKNESPSSRMLLYAARHPRGLSAAELLTVVAAGPAGEARLESLIDGGLVRRTAAGMEATPAGRRLAAAIGLVSRVYGLAPPPRPVEGNA